eukprot:TRINITY_DN56347_c0_g1_i1.p1 TRINITY_DN56347_c0_g1~~TRINITY_DN56347_c0_g1_i1.p1  ORF type:complete len:547 (+),score=116.41 TRINITY_DN56347_c0_g1_i1:160-1641(+)
MAGTRAGAAPSVPPAQLLRLHEQGKWALLGPEMRRRMLVPEEMRFNSSTEYCNRLVTRLLPGGLEHPQMKAAWTGQLGNQVGCCHPEFKRQAALDPPAPLHGWQVPGTQFPREPGLLRLLKAARGRRVCIVGDSVDAQFWTAVKQLAWRSGRDGAGGPRLRYYTSSTALRPAIDYRRGSEQEAEYKRKGIRRWWGGLFNLMHLDVVDPSRRLRPTRFSYGKLYINQPFDMEFYEQHCDIISLALGMHYNHDTFRGRGGQHDNYTDAIKELTEWAVNFSAARPRTRIAIIREVSPKHLQSPGHRDNLFLPTERSAEKLAVQPIPRWQRRQRYNAATDAVFAAMAATCPQPSESAARWLHVDPLRSAVYKFWTTYGWADRTAAERRRHAERGGALVVGLVWRWRVWDLFVDHTEWHYNQWDSAHFCYIPTLWDAVFERLGLIVEDAATPRSCTMDPHATDPPPLAPLLSQHLGPLRPSPTPRPAPPGRIPRRGRR